MKTKDDANDASRFSSMIAVIQRIRKGRVDLHRAQLWSSPVE
jgi:hypothetical protein